MGRGKAEEKSENRQKDDCSCPKDNEKGRKNKARNQNKRHFQDNVARAEKRLQPRRRRVLEKQGLDKKEPPVEIKRGARRRSHFG